MKKNSRLMPTHQSGSMEDWKYGRLEVWKYGRLEVWKCCQLSTVNCQPTPERVNDKPERLANIFQSDPVLFLIRFLP